MGVCCYLVLWIVVRIMKISTILDIACIILLLAFLPNGPHQFWIWVTHVDERWLE